MGVWGGGDLDIKIIVDEFRLFSCSRTLDDVHRIMKFAKLDQSELLPTVQCVSFVDLVDSDTVKLMEVDKSILQHVVSGDR